MVFNFSPPNIKFKVVFKPYRRKSKMKHSQTFNIALFSPLVSALYSKYQNFSFLTFNTRSNCFRTLMVGGQKTVHCWHIARSPPNQPTQPHYVALEYLWLGLLKHYIQLICALDQITEICVLFHILGLFDFVTKGVSYPMNLDPVSSMLNLSLNWEAQIWESRSWEGVKKHPKVRPEVSGLCVETRK